MSKRSTRSQSNNNSVTKKVRTEDNHNLVALQDVAHKLRIDSIDMTKASNSGHPTSCASISEIMSVLFFDKSGMHYDHVNASNFTSDRFVLSKGHAAPILYAAWAEAGYYKHEELMNLRKFDSDLEGHPTPKLPYVDTATGSLGQGLGVAAGMAYSSKYLDKLNNRYWVICGDGETAEGSIWEAANFASYYKLDNITCIVDVNRLGQSQATSLGHDVDTYAKRFESFGWQVIQIDGHNIAEIVEAFEKSRSIVDKPTCIVAKTMKGKYIADQENLDNFHGKPITGDKYDAIVAHIRSLIKNPDVKLTPTKPDTESWPELPEQKFELGQLNYEIGQKVATRNAYGEALKRLGQNDKNGQIVGLDGDTKNSTFAITFQKAFPERFVECFIAEQNMVSIAQGLAARNKVPFASTFAAFFTRACDQIRMGGVSRTSINLVGSHSGVSIGEDGPSQMALEELGMFKSLPNSVVFYPSDAVSTERAVELIANHNGIRYIRTGRPANPVLYSNDEVFEIGQSKTVFQSDSDKLVIVSAGVILHEALNAAKALKEQGINVRVVDLFSVKPVDREGLIKAANESSGLVLTVEENYQHGGIFDVVLQALAQEKGVAVHQVAVDSVPRSGKPQELLDFYGLSAAKIQEKVKSLLQ